MRKKVRDLKSAIREMEESMVALDLEGFQGQIKRVRRMLSNIEQEFGKAVISADSVVLSKEDNKVTKSRPYDIINTIAFLYKPTKRIDIFEGSYLEFFAEERTEQLMKAMAINQHNEFWKQHKTVHGNIFGSVPKELIKPENADQLEKYGWHEVNVNVLDFGKKVEDERELVRFCNISFPYYILLLEETTGSYLVLEYLI
ncbi:hypothetical protein [Fusibacter sp. JL216-2]|uniref:hypothetical protein n=1 Tax=Fusibacter sp. JL216-2 TaxID=3071453 RepID=UPI003D327F75